MKKYLPGIFVLLVLAGCPERTTDVLRAGKDAAVILDLRSLHTVQTQFLIKNGRYGTLEELRDAGLIDSHLAAGRKHSYVITIVSADARGYVLRADPDAENKLSYRHYYMDQTGLVRLNHSRPAGPSDPPASM